MRNGKNFFVYLWQIRRKLFSWYVGEKNVGLDKRRQASQKEHVLSLKRLCQLKLSTRSFAGLIPDSRGGEEQNREEGEMAQIKLGGGRKKKLIFREEGEIGGKSREEGEKKVDF